MTDDDKALIAKARAHIGKCATFMAGEYCPDCQLASRLADALERAMGERDMAHIALEARRLDLD